MAAHHAFLKDESDVGRQWVITPLHPKHYGPDLASCLQSLAKAFLVVTKEQGFETATFTQILGLPEQLDYLRMHSTPFLLGGPAGLQRYTPPLKKRLVIQIDNPP